MLRLRRIDESTIGDHAYLRPADRCVYLYEYTSNRDYTFSQTNQLIKNLKIKPTETNRLYYKTQAINHCTACLQLALPPPWLNDAVLVPVPPSKAVGHPDYDPRMEQVARGVRAGQDVRPMIRQKISMTAAHEVGQGGRRPTIDELLDAYEFDESQTYGAPTKIGVLDDVLTNGTHFRAMSAMLAERYPAAVVTGVFIARRVFPPDEV